MPEALKKSEVDGKTDPTVAKHYDTDTPKPEQISDLYSFIDKQMACLLTTQRPDVGPVARSMAIAKRVGPDFLFLANAHSQKFKDIENSKMVQVTFQDSSTQNWGSVTGKATVASNSDPRIKDLWGPTMRAWFGDLGDGTHDGSAQDPRMALIEVKSDYIVYWKSTVGTLGFMKEVGVGAATGKVATNGLLRELKGSDISQMRETTE